MRKQTNPNSLANLKGHEFKKGESGNPGGTPKGKRVSTWIAELGDIPHDKWPVKKTLPMNALIAMSMIEKSLIADKDSASVAAASLVIEKVEGKQTQPISLEQTISKEQFIEWARKHATD